MKKEKTYLDGVMVGFTITAIIYSVLLGIVIKIIIQSGGGMVDTSRRAKKQTELPNYKRENGYLSIHTGSNPVLTTMY